MFNSLIPEIRFEGFTDAWEQRQLITLTEYFTDGDWIESKDQSDSGIRLLQTGNIGVTRFINKQSSAKWISEKTFYRLKCKEVFSDDILISRLPEPAGRACIVPSLKLRAVTAVDCTIVRVAQDCCRLFLIQYLSTEGYFRLVNNALAGGTRQRVSHSNLGRFTILKPKTLSEQRQIGALLNQYDTAITIHQRKVEKLENLKQALLEKMFV